jgi:putative membrane-bound dehydrogenase-like protein
MRDYSERRDERLGRIRLLVDTDGDGLFDRSTIFAEGLPWPTAVICYDGGVFVGATPDIWYFKDTNSDGVADERRLIYTGFAEPTPGANLARERLNVQGLFNSFNWTLDNRIHGASGTMGGFVHQPNSTNGVDVRGRDFSFDPRNPADLRAETGGGQHGLSFDDTGRKFVCHNSSHIRLVMYEQRYAGRNPWYAMPSGLLDIPADGPAAEVYRISPEEPWRVIRTAWRVSGKVSGPIEGGGRSSGYFTSATGITIYRGNAFPPDFSGDAFIADVGSNLIHRKKLYPDGVALIAKRPPDEQNVEFIASKDLWFRPVQFANAPDGTLYVDMYREVVEHPWSIPESIKKHLDLNSGNDRGRIYRIAPDGFKQPPLPRLGQATTAELVAALAHPNGWHRDTAARLLYQRQDRAAVPLLKDLLKQSPSALGRMHALYVLQGLGALSSEFLLRACRDNDKSVRMHALRLSEQGSGNLADAAALMSRDLSARVRYQLAFSLGELEFPNRIDLLAAIAEKDSGDAWIRSALLSSLKTGAGDLFLRLSSSAAPIDKVFLRDLLALTGARNDNSEIKQMLGKLNRSAQAESFDLLGALATGLERSGHFDRTVFQDSFERALQSSASNSASEEVRIAATGLLGHSSFRYAGPVLLRLIQPSEPPSIELAALKALGKYVDREVGTSLLEQWNTLTPRLRTEALDLMVARSERATDLLEALNAHRLTSRELTAVQTRALRNHSNEKVRSLAAKVLAAPDPQTRALDAYKGALESKGDIARGKTIYVQRCASCHRSDKEGSSVGPDFVAMKNAGREKLLANIIDPNREVPPQYVAFTAETKTGDVVSGLIRSETGTSITFLAPNGVITPLLRSEIAKLQSQQQSLMPEGLVADLSQQQIADLLAFILESR